MGFVVKKSSEFEVCPHCATKSSIVYDHRTVKIKDAPIRNKMVFLFIKKRRFFCKKCYKPFTEPVSGISKYQRTTQRLKSSVCWASDHFMNLSDVERYARLSTGFVYKTVYEQLELRQRKNTYPLPKSIGIDEHSIRKPKYKATQYCTIIVDHKNKKVFDLIDSRDVGGLKAGFERIKGHENVEYITMDLSSTFRSFCKQTFTNATIVADRFHVQRCFSKILNRYRKQFTGDDRKNPIRKLLLRNSENLEWYERRAVNEWLKDKPVLNELYLFKEWMRRIYKTKGYKKASRSFNKMCDLMGKSAVKEILSLRKVLIDWKTEILNYHKTKLTNGRVEGFNRKAKLCQRAAYGYSNFENYRYKFLNFCR